MLWLTGLSGSGKSTLAHATELALRDAGVHTYVLDGDSVRRGLCRDLGFSREDRRENIRRIAEVARLFVDAGIVVLTAFISPYREERDFARSLLERGEFIEIHVRCPLPVCERRDVKGLYAKARRGEIRNFTGIDDPYEEPLSPELTIDTDRVSVDAGVAAALDYLRANRVITPPAARRI